MPTYTITRQGPDVTAEAAGPNLYRQAAERKLTVSQLCEQMDPTSEREAKDQGLDAFERVLKAAGIVSGPVEQLGIEASTYEEINNDQRKRALFPELMQRIWRQATEVDPRTRMTGALVATGERAVLLSGDAAVGTISNAWSDYPAIRAKRLVPPVPLSAIVARTTAIRGQNYRTQYVIDDFGTDAYRLKRVMEGAQIPTTSMVTGAHTFQVHKFGRAIRATYEQLRWQTVDRIAFLIARMALQAEVDKVALAMNTLINGDGNQNTSAPVITLTSLDAAASAGTLTLKAYLTFRLRFGAGYIPDTMLAQEATTAQVFMLPVNTVNGMPLALLPSGALGSIRPIQPLLSGGIAYGITPDAPSLKILMFDSTVSLERITSIGSTISEIERYILNQTQVLTMTEMEGFAVIDPNGYKLLNVNA